MKPTHTIISNKGGEIYKGDNYNKARMIYDEAKNKGETVFWVVDGYIKKSNVVNESQIEASKANFVFCEDETALFVVFDREKRNDVVFAKGVCIWSNGSEQIGHQLDMQFKSDSAWKKFDGNIEIYV